MTTSRTARNGTQPLHRLLWLAGLLVLSSCKTPEPPSPLDEPLVARFYLEARPGTPGVPVTMPYSRITLSVSPKPVLTEKDIVKVEYTRVGQIWGLYFDFSHAASLHLFQETQANVGARLVLKVNDKPVGGRLVDQPIGEGGMVIFVELPNEDLPPMVERIRRTSLGPKKKAP